jgi:formamidopyrimidine-DNA glycosylase
MPELPEVTTTVHGLNQTLPNLTITATWSDYHVNTKSTSLSTIKNSTFFKQFKKEVVGEKIINAERRGKNILIHLTHNKTILIHMKMTGHLLYGKYMYKNSVWNATEKGPLQESWNQFIHFTLSLSNNHVLAFSDMRKFAKVTLIATDMWKEHTDLSPLGPEPLTELDALSFYKRLITIPSGMIKTVLMNQSVVAGIGNIYSDEILWDAGIHPERRVGSLSQKDVKKIFTSMIDILHKGIELGGDSMSDYRNIHGLRGDFQNSHNAYRKTGKPCQKKGCSGTIHRKIIGGRSGHFCNVHQK